MKRIEIYKIALWDSIQKLFKSGGDSILLMSKVLLVVVTVAASGTSLLAQAKVTVKPVKLLDLPEIKPNEHLPQVVQDMPLEFQYFNGDKNKTSTFREMNKNFVQLFFWDASYPAHYTDLKRIYDYREAMGRHSNVILVISKHDQETLEKVKSTLEKYKKEFDVKMDIACIIGNQNLDKLFRVGAFPKYAQINKDSVYYSEMSVDAMFKSF